MAMVIPLHFSSLLNAVLILISASGIIGYSLYILVLWHRRDIKRQLIWFLALADFISIYRFMKISLHLATGNPYWESNVYITALCGLGAPLTSMYLEWLVVFGKFQEGSHASSSKSWTKWVFFIISLSTLTSLLPFVGIGAYETFESPHGTIKFGCHLDFKRRGVQAPLLFLINSICAAVPIIMWIKMQGNSKILDKNYDFVMRFTPYMVIFSYVPYMILCCSDMFTDFRWAWYAEILPHFLPKIMLAARPYFYLLSDDVAFNVLSNKLKFKQS